MNILIVDDDESTIEVLSHTLRKLGYTVAAAYNGTEAYRMVRTGKYRIVISDWQMPGMTGLELCEKIRQRSYGGYIYIILLTSHSGLDNVVCGLEAGADDFLAKPFEPAELLVRIHAGERILGLESREMTIFALAKLVESRDQETGGHLERMREYTRILAEQLACHPDFSSEIDGQYIDLLYLTTPLHDIGKVAIPDAILLKPGSLTPDELRIMRTHTTIGAQTLEEVSHHYTHANFLTMAQEIALTHHEWFNGNGYPQGLAGDEIPLCGRITAVADVYDALTSKRTYKDAYPHQMAMELILRSSGEQFDPRVVEALQQGEQEILFAKYQLESLGQAVPAKAPAVIPFSIGTKTSECV